MALFSSVQAQTPPPTRSELQTLSPSALAHRLSSLFADQLIVDKSNPNNFLNSYWTLSQKTSWPDQCTAKNVTFTYQLTHAPKSVKPSEDTGKLANITLYDVYNMRGKTYKIYSPDCHDFHPDKGDAFFLASTEWEGEYAPKIWTQFFELRQSGDPNLTEACTYGGMACNSQIIKKLLKTRFWRVSDCGMEDSLQSNSCLLYEISGDGIGASSRIQIFFKGINADIRPVRALFILNTDARPW